jgi:hypothetical protein
LLLDDTAERLKLTGRYHARRQGLVVTHGVHIHEQARKEVAEFVDCARRVDLDGARLELRLGREHRVVAAHREVFEVLLESSRTISRPSPLERGANAPIGADRTFRDGVHALEVARLRFADAAHALVRSDLVEVTHRTRSLLHPFDHA